MGFEEWSSHGMLITSTASNEAVKLYDAALTQFAGWYDDPLLGGLSETLVKLNQADPYFILGNALSLCIQLVGYTKSYHCSDELRKQIDDLEKNALKQRDSISSREFKHAQAVVRMSKLDWNGAAKIWEDILQACPVDMLALKMSFYMYFFTGQKVQQFESMNRVFPHFQKSSTVNSHLAAGMLAFVLEETGQFTEAEKYARSGLARAPCDGWTTHALAHTYESQSRFTDGLTFLRDSCHLWSRSNLLACHNYWHLSLFNIATGNFDGAVELLDREILPRVKASQTSFTICDASSLLYRLSLIEPKEKCLSEDVVRSKFTEVYSVARQYLNQHILPFNDVHFLMSCLGSGHQREASDLIDSLKLSHFAEVHPQVTELTVQLMESMRYFQEDNYEKSTDILCSVRDSIVQIGGSDAQRGVFDKLLFTTALKSSKPEHRKLTSQLFQSLAK